MENFLASNLFRYAIFPAGSAMLGVAMKLATRNDRHTSFRKEDLAIGLDLILAAGLMFIVLTTDRALTVLAANRELARVLAAPPIDSRTAMALQETIVVLTGKLAVSGWVIAVFFFCLWTISTIVRKWGWKSETELTPVVGIAAPFILGIIALAGVTVGALQ